MISKIRTCLAGITLMFAASNVNAVPVEQCDPFTTDAADVGINYLKANWDEFEQRVQAGGMEIAECIKKKVFETGTLICDRYECPYPGLTGWVIKGKNEAYMCPWYYEERIDHLNILNEKAACIGARTANLFAISCEAPGQQHWDFYGPVLVNMMKRDYPNVKISPTVDCGFNNETAPSFTPDIDGRTYVK